MISKFHAKTPSKIQSAKGTIRLTQVAPGCVKLWVPLFQSIFSRRTREEIMAEESKCKNPPCTCPQPPDGKYCSASCEGTGDTIELDCDCSHEACQGNF